MILQIVLPLTDAESLSLMTLLLILFTIFMSIICLFLLIQIKKAEKVARPFLTSFLLYFLLLTVANLFQIYHNVLNFDYIIVNGLIGMYTTYIVFLLTFIAPIYLIYQIEKKFFMNMKSQSKFHLFTILILLLLILFNIRVITAVLDGASIYPRFVILDYIVFATMLFGLELFYIVFAFLYLGYKAVGKYRKYAIWVSLAWLTNNAANVIVIIGNVIVSSQNLYFIAKIIGVLVFFYCLYNLYTLTED